MEIPFNNFRPYTFVLLLRIMDITVKNLYVKVSPRKARPVLFGLRGEKAEAARDKMLFTHKKSASFLYELLKSGIAAAKENDIESSNLYVKSVCCNEGPRLKRRRFWSKGQSRRITKRMSHLVLTLTDEPAIKSKIKNDKGPDESGRAS